MRAILIILTTITSCCEASPNIRMFIGEYRTSFILESKDAYKVYDPKDGKLLSKSSNGRCGVFQVTHTPSGLKWGEIFPGTHQTKVSPRSTLLVNGKEYEGSIVIYESNGSLFVINELPIESVVRSLIMELASRGYHDETLRVASIVERTSLYWAIQHPQNKFFDLKHDGIPYYGSVGKTPRVSYLVESTKHTIMMYEGTPFPTSCSINSAGVVASYSDIHREDHNTPPGLTLMHLCANIRNSYHWRYKTTLDKISKQIGIDVDSIDLFRDSKSGKVYALKFNSADHYLSKDFFESRSLLGRENISSNDFHILIEGNEVEFSGLGIGDGSGLCLFFCEEVANRGYSWREIISENFSKSTITNLDFILKNYNPSQ